MINKLKYITIGIRLTTSLNYGKGHYARCIELAKELNYKVIFFTDPNYTINKKIKFVMESTNSSLDQALKYLKLKRIDALIFDNYNISSELIESAAKFGICAVIDDYKIQWKRPLIFATNLGSSIDHYKKNNDVFAGPKYALISDKFYNASFKNKNFKKKKIISHVLIQMGAIDSKNNIQKILTVLKIYNRNIKHITVVLNKNAPHFEKINNLLKAFDSSLLLEVKTISKMINLYREHNLIIGAAGVSLLERVSLGIYHLAFSLNKNQDINLQSFDKLKLGISGGRIDKISKSDLNFICKKFISENNSQYISNNSYNKIIDGRGSKRIIKIIKERIIQNA